MVEDILSDSSMERMDRIDRLESILAAATQHALTPTSGKQFIFLSLKKYFSNAYIFKLSVVIILKIK